MTRDEPGQDDFLGLGRRQPQRHGRRQAGAFGLFDRGIVTGVGVPQDADPGIAIQNTLEPLGGRRVAVGDDGHAGTDAAAAEAVNGDEIGAGRAVQQRVEDRPVGDGVGAAEPESR